MMKEVRKRPLRVVRRLLGITCLLGVTSLLPGSEPGDAAGNIVVFSFNDLGMHCMNEDFSEIVVLPPFNNLRAVVVRRGHEPDVLDNATVTYKIPTHTREADKTNFWTHAEALFGTALPPNIGLTGNGLSGTMSQAPHKYFEASGIPMVPIDDGGRFNPYPIAEVTARDQSGNTATTYTVVPVSSEMTCNLCHNSPGVSTATDILQDHDELHGTTLLQQRPVLCASCHADNALGTPGEPGVPNFSSAMHSAHAPRMGQVQLENKCYACHPGIRTQCQRDVHLGEGLQCMDCHGTMSDVGNPARNPWVSDLPRCSDCHNRAGFEFEQPGKLYKDSVGHGGVACAACHGSPHAITPALTPTDNLQANLLQGHSGVINTCTVCHTSQPDDPFFHKEDD